MLLFLLLFSPLNNPACNVYLILQTTTTFYHSDMPSIIIFLLSKYQDIKLKHWHIKILSVFCFQTFRIRQNGLIRTHHNNNKNIHDQIHNQNYLLKYYLIFRGIKLSIPLLTAKLKITMLHPNITGSMTFFTICTTI